MEEPGSQKREVPRELLHKFLVFRREKNSNHFHFFSDLEYPEGAMVIDGSQLEGGGQILRLAFGSAAILGRKVVVEKIRAGRPKPGLANQHLCGLELVDIFFSLEWIYYGWFLQKKVGKMCMGNVQGCRLQSTVVSIEPRELGGSKFVVCLSSQTCSFVTDDRTKTGWHYDCGYIIFFLRVIFNSSTRISGACTLLVQISLPVCLFNPEPVEVLFHFL